MDHAPEERVSVNQIYIHSLTLPPNQIPQNVIKDHFPIGTISHPKKSQISGGLGKLNNPPSPSTRYQDSEKNNGHVDD